MGNIDIQTDEIQATAVVELFFCESLSRKQRVPADPRKASSMPRSGLLGLVAGLRATQRQRCLPGDFTRLGIVLELDHQKHCTLKRLSLLFTSYTALARRGLMIVPPPQGEVNRPGLVRVSSG